jgi:hypothetical protein
MGIVQELQRRLGDEYLVQARISLIVTDPAFVSTDDGWLAKRVDELYVASIPVNIVLLDTAQRLEEGAHDPSTFGWMEALALFVRYSCPTLSG